MHHEHIPVHFHLSAHQKARLRNGHNVQIKHEHIGTGGAILHLHHLNHKKVAKAHHHHKGVRIGLSPHEIEKSSGSLWDSIKSGFNTIKNSPILNKIAGTALDYGTNALGNAVGLGQYTGDVNSARKQLLGVGLKHRGKGINQPTHINHHPHNDYTGMGVKHHQKHNTRLHSAKNESNFLEFNSPAMHPYVDHKTGQAMVPSEGIHHLEHHMNHMHLKPRGRKKKVHNGGSFLASGY